MPTYTWDDLDALCEQCESVFGEKMTFGFEIGPEQVPLMRECIEKRSQAPLEKYVREDLAEGKVF